MIEKGKLIVIEGIDGSGKDTQIELLEQKIKKEMPDQGILVTHEPWDSSKSPEGKRIRRILTKNERKIDPEDIGIDATKFQTLCVADRYIHWVKMILPALKKGKIVICNRERMSTFSYGHSYGIPFREMLKWHNLLPDPSLILYLKISPECAIERLKKRSGKTEFFEKLESLKKAAKSYDLICQKKVLKNIEVLNGEKSPELISKDIWQEIQNLLMEARK